MSMLPGEREARVQDMVDTVRGSNKCRIPQRLPPGRSKPPPTSIPKSKEPAKQKPDVLHPAPAPAQHSRFTAKHPTRPRFSELRPKSGARAKDDLYSGRLAQPTSRFSRSEKYAASVKKPTALPQLISEAANKTARPVILVPCAHQRPHGKVVHSLKNCLDLPDQETIRKHEDFESRQSDILDTSTFNDMYDKESITSQCDKLMELKINWQEKMVRYEKMKNELTDKQKLLLELYASICKTHEMMSTYGENTYLPSAEELTIMNVAKLSPEQLLQLCAGVSFGDKRQNGQEMVDVQKLYKMPMKLVTMCEQTLLKRKEIIDWFDSVMATDKGIKMSTLSKKLNEFSAENAMLKCALDKVTGEFNSDLDEIIQFMRKEMNQTMALHLRTEELTYEVSELSSQNADLRKQIHNADHLRSQTVKTRVEELQKEVKDEKCKRLFLRDRLSRTEGQAKVNQEKSGQIEAELKQARARTWSLERTIQQLNEQNQKLQSDFDEQLSTLTKSIKEHTIHLEEIVDAREKLQTEKDDLERRLKEIADHYNKSLKDVKHDMNTNVVKLIEAEKKYEQAAEDKSKLAAQVESLCAQLTNAELRLKDATKQIQEKDIEIDMALNSQKYLEATKKELHEAHLEITEYKNELARHNEIVEEIERRFKESITLQQNLTSELSTKDEYIAELEKKHFLLEQQLQENESKMDSYVKQLTSLKSQIGQLQEEFGEVENLNELHEKVNLQRAQLLEATRQNRELAEALQKKEEELEQLSAGLAEQDSNIEQREGVIKILSEKEEEQTNIIKILRNNLELRSQADNNINQQLAEKNTEIEALITDLNIGKQQISNLENIILSLRDQNRKAMIQRNRDQDKIAILQSKIAELEAYHIETSRIIDTPSENLDSLIKIIEDELGSPMEPQMNTKEHNFINLSKKYTGDRKGSQKNDFREEIRNASPYQPECEKYPAKDFMKKTYMVQREGDNLGRKKAITSMDTQKWVATSEPPDPAIDTYHLATRDTSFSNVKPPLPSRNLAYVLPTQLREDRKYKMFKLAGHRL